MKKGIALIFLALFLSIFLISSVSAAQSLTDLAKGTIDGFVQVLKEPLKQILGESTTEGDIFAAKLLIVIVLISLSSILLEKAMPTLFGGKNKWLLWIISIGVSLLGVRFLNSDFIYNIIIPNEALAVTLASLLPFLLFFWVVEFGGLLIGPFQRRVAWTFFAVVMLAIYVTRLDDLKGGIGQAIYPLVVVFSFLIAVFDGTLESLKNAWKMDKAKEITRGTRRVVHYNKLRDIIDIYQGSIRTGVAYIGGGLNPATYPGASIATETGNVAFEKDQNAIWNVIKSL